MSTTIGFGKNIASLLAQGRLGSTTAAMASSLERLSSGLRINRASDDAAGLAIATTLGADTRVYSQGIRNINDGISALNIADGALNQFSSILMRLRELATQAANGSFSLTQRRSLDSEAFQLTNEFNRLTQSTRFNGLNLLDGGLSSMRIQLGYGASGSIAFGMGQSLGQSVGTGGFSSPMTTFTAQTVKIATGDMNGDGKPDRVSADIIG
ncbi:MAG: flagellin, partial [Proteobacteria bacterium]